MERVRLDELKPADTYLLSYPLQPERYAEMAERFPGYPLIAVNNDNEILFGSDLYEHYKATGVTDVPVMRTGLDEKEGLFLAYNLKDKFTGVNLYEKLMFIKKILPLAERQEIYNRTALDVNMNRPLMGKLERLLKPRYRDALAQEKIILKTAIALCSFHEEDREVLLSLFEKVSFSSSHQLRILEMAEEIIFREKCTAADIFARLGIHDALEEDKPQKNIIGLLFEFRNPMYAASEKKWLEEIKALDLPSNMQVTHYPFFEKKQMEITVRLSDEDELKAFAAKINKLSEG